jgi:hypothetical protein
VELTGLSFRNYKAFPGRVAIEVRPLTILIGRNSSGKSAIARLPLLLGASLSERAQAPLELAGDDFDLGGSFVDIVHNRSPHGNVSVGATFQDEHGEYVLSATVQFYEDLALQVITELNFKSPGYDVKLTRLSEAPDAEPGLYAVDWSGERALKCEVSFTGLIPSLPSSSLPHLMTDDEIGNVALFKLISSQISDAASLLQMVTYLGPFRQAPSRSYRFPGGLPQNVGRSGATAPDLLAADAKRRGGAVLKAVTAWYRENLGDWLLDVDMGSTGDKFSLVLRRPGAPSVAINITDVGTGLSQVLPVVTQRLFEQVTGKRGSLEIIEQPELHLHPYAHGSLADLYISAVSLPGTRFLIETHSENFLLRLRRRVAEGTLAPEKVRIYWVDDSQGEGSRIVPIEVLRDGEVSTWPKGVFSEDFEELKAIRAAQRPKGGA